MRVRVVFGCWSQCSNAPKLRFSRPLCNPAAQGGVVSLFDAYYRDKSVGPGRNCPNPPLWLLPPPPLKLPAVQLALHPGSMETHYNAPMYSADRSGRVATTFMPKNMAMGNPNRLHHFPIFLAAEINSCNAERPVRFWLFYLKHFWHFFALLAQRGTCPSTFLHY